MPKNKKPVKLTKAEQRVRIARDVLGWLRSGSVTLEKGVYITRKGKATKNPDWKPGDPLQPYVNTLLASCSVCALGGLFLASVDRYNKVQVPGLDDDPLLLLDCPVELERWFSWRQLFLIDSAYEGWEVNVRKGTIDFYFMLELYPNHKDRLKTILLNIIRNKGTFVLEQERTKYSKQVKKAEA